MIKVYYMTGTGNSLKTARDIGASTGAQEILSMPRLSGSAEAVKIEGDAIGFVFPVYFGRPPVFVQEFIKNSEFGKIGYIFAVAVGGGLFGRTLKIIEKLLLRKGLGLDAGFSIEMPGNYPYIGRLHRKPHSRLLSEASGRVKRISEVIIKRGAHRPPAGLGIFEGLYSILAFDVPYDLSKRHTMDRHFWINDGCRNCGLCIEVCPVDNIVQGRWKPSWKHGCINCLACYHICPFRGIDLRCEWKMIELVPHERVIFRYRHPEISEKDLIDSI